MSDPADREPRPNDTDRPTPAVAPSVTVPATFEPRPAPPEGAAPKPRWRLHIGLFLATCASTFLIGGPIYSLALMTILTCHEFGHYLQARRYGVPASLPYFIPFPLSVFGTLGAVIAMRPQKSPAHALFDLAITGPLAGLVPTFIFSIFGLRLSRIVERSLPDDAMGQTLEAPLVFQWLLHWILGPVEPSQIVELHPMAYAGWVGIFITSLNLLPVGQLDGGHILYTLIPRWAHHVSRAFLGLAAAAVLWGGLWHYGLLVLLLLLMGTKHPPTVDAGTRLSRPRVVLGWLSLSFIILGLTLNPFDL